MPSAITTPLSGLQAASLGLLTEARNIVNVNSPDHKPERVVQTSTPGGGTRAHTVELRPASVPVLILDHPEADENGILEMPNVSPAAEAAETIKASNAYWANANVIETADEMLGELVDDSS